MTAPEESADPVDVWTPGTRTVIVAEAVIIAIAVGYIGMAAQLGLGTAADPGPGLAPLAFGGIVVVFFGIDLVMRVVKGALAAGSGLPPLRVAVILFAILVYAAGAVYLGHILASFIAVTAMVWVFGSRRWWMNPVIGVVSALATYQLFVLLGVSLPAGVLGLEW